MRRFRLAGALTGLAIAFVPCAGATTENAVFLELQTLFAYEEPSETKLDFAADGSSFAFACDRLAAVRGAVAHRDRAALVVRLSCETSGRPRTGTAVWLHGGPFTAYDPEIGPDQAALLSLGYELIIPLYPGSADREHRIVGDRIFPTMEHAIDEIRTAISWAQRRDRRVLLVGDSFGAVLAAATAARLRRSDRLILQNPLLRPPSIAGPPPDAVLAGAAPEGYDRIEDVPPDARQELAGKAFRGFMADWLDRDLISILRDRPPRRMLVVYGDRDSRIGLERMPELLTLGGQRYPSLMLGDSDHAPLGTRAELDAFVELLRR